jgi:hypothetical protein
MDSYSLCPGSEVNKSSLFSNEHFTMKIGDLPTTVTLVSRPIFFPWRVATRLSAIAEALTSFSH